MSFSRPDPLTDAEWRARLADEARPSWSVTTVPDRDGSPAELPSIALERKLRLARALANLARWRGSALAWPLLDARPLPGSRGVLCALPRRDSFLMLSPASKGARVAAYRWNGFGFDGIADEGAVAACRSLFGEKQADTLQTQP